MTYCCRMCKLGDGGALESSGCVLYTVYLHCLIISSADMVTALCYIMPLLIKNLNANLYMNSIVCPISIHLFYLINLF